MALRREERPSCQRATVSWAGSGERESRKPGRDRRAFSFLPFKSSYSAVKRKFGNSVTSKTDAAMVNEVLSKPLAHNFCCLNHEQEELGIVPVFLKDEAACSTGPGEVMMQGPGFTPRPFLFALGIQ